LDDYGFDSGGYSLWNDTPDYGSSWDIGGGYDAPSYNFGGGGGGGGLDSSWLNSYIQPQPMAPQPMAPSSGGYSLGAPPMQPQAPAAPIAGASQANPWIGGLMGSLGPMAGLIGALVNQGQGPTSGPKPTTAQKAAMEQGNVMAQQGASGQLPAQQMQMSLLQALASGQGLPAGYSQLVEQAFQPQMGDLYTQAAKAGRQRGFHDAPGTSPPGGAILGPGLANLQGQMASAKLGLMHSLPQLFNQPAATQGGFAQNYLQAAQGAPMQQQVTQPMAPQIAQGVGGLISGAAQGYNAAAQQGQQQDTLNSLIQALQGNQVGGLSYTRQG
jgi:hypothetical protein